MGAGAVLVAGGSPPAGGTRLLHLAPGPGPALGAGAGGGGGAPALATPPAAHRQTLVSPGHEIPALGPRSGVYLLFMVPQ